MGDTPLLDWKQAESRRDLGITRSVDHADRTEPNWSERAASLVLEYARAHGEFLAEDAREAVKIEAPPDGRAWGAVFQRLRKRGDIEMVGYAAARSSNLSPKCVWRCVRALDAAHPDERAGRAA